MIFQGLNRKNKHWKEGLTITARILAQTRRTPALELSRRHQSEVNAEALTGGAGQHHHLAG
jgi:hypothetical protein